MTRSDRDPDAYDRIREDAMDGTAERVRRTPGPWRKKPDSCEIISETRPICLVHTYGSDDKDWPINAALIAHAPEQAARIAELEAQLAAATERERALVNMLTFFGTELSVDGRLKWQQPRSQPASRRRRKGASDGRGKTTGASTSAA